MPKEVSYKNLLIFKCYLKKEILEESKNVTFLVSNRNYLMTFTGMLDHERLKPIAISPFPPLPFYIYSEHLGFYSKMTSL